MVKCYNVFTEYREPPSVAFQLNQQRTTDIRIKVRCGMDNNRASHSLMHMKKSDLRITDFCDMERFAQMMKDWGSSTGIY